ncbi:hypothetical protein LEP1GSC082_3258 [Leptospira kirschneri str. H2]|nr:hypothetical protein LEP1GSC082_3258 [Leptospira kirschneri str. H2]
METKAQRFPKTQRLASTVARSNSASHSPWVVRQVALENSTQRFPKTQRLASTVARSNSASHSPWVVRQVVLENSTQRFPKGRVVGWELNFTENLS